jgi:hypothetical protein
MAARRSRWLLVAALTFSLPIDSGAQKADPPAKPPPAADKSRHALLVGVTFYPNMDKSKHLVGPGNDVPMLKKLLVEKFRFSPDQIATLTEEDGQKRGKDFFPTKANIKREFDHLAEVAKPGDYVVITMSGHGSQQPEDPKSPDPEPDGLDETFLPRDVGKWDGAAGTVTNAIIDDELGAWLQAIRDKKAFIWLTMDSCHSGTMMRDAEEVTRDLDMTRDLGIPKPAIEKAVKEAEAREAKKPEKSRGVEPPAAIKLGNKGGIIAFYAAQPTEVTLEREMPPKAAGGKCYGLFTYTICQVLTQATEKSDKPLTYRELAQRVQAQYETWGRHAPTPMIEGDLQDAEVLGDKKWPGRSSILLSTREGMKVNAGALRGLTVGSVLAVTAGGGGDPAGYVRVTEARLTDADVAPCAYNQAPARDKLDDGSSCHVVMIDAGDQQLGVAVDPLYDPPAEKGKEAPAPLPVPEEAKKALDAAVKGLGGEGSLLKPVEQVKQADWLVRWEAKSNTVVVVPRSGWTDGQIREGVAAFRAGPPDAQLGARLKETLTAIARVENLKKLAAGAEAGSDAGTLKVKLEPRRRENKNDKQGKFAVSWPAPNLALYDGDLMAFKITNTGTAKADVTLLYIDSGYGINPLYPNPKTGENNRLSPGDSTVVRAGIDGSTVGPESLVMIVTKGVGAVPLDFTVLAQPTLDNVRKVTPRDVKESGHLDAVKKGLDSPLGQMLRRGLYGEGSTRGMKVDEVDDNLVTLLSWHVKSQKRPAEK